MNEMEVLVQKEKDTSYNQRNKDLFTFYILTLINQEGLKRRHKRNLMDRSEKTNQTYPALLSGNECV